MFTGPQHTLTLRGNLGFPQSMPTEAETCRNLAVPESQAAGRANEICFLDLFPADKS
jgi:hypothetical protein